VKVLIRQKGALIGGITALPLLLSLFWELPQFTHNRVAQIPVNLVARLVPTRRRKLPGYSTIRRSERSWYWVKPHRGWRM